MKKFGVKSFVGGLAIGALFVSGTSYALPSITKLVVNGEEISTNSLATVVDGKVLVPARSLAEALGAKVAWDADTNTVVVTTGAASAGATPPTDAPAAPALAAAHWSYEGESGPDQWYALADAYAACKTGVEQSPINIVTSNVSKDKSAAALTINYHPTAVTVMNNGHTIQANDASGTNSITVDGVEYKLAQFHFHTPSENQIDGQNFPMEGHLVHKSADGKLAVLGFLIKEGQANEPLAELWSKLPKDETKTDVALDKAIDLTGLLPADKSTYQFEGSLTTPPCSEGVRWFVLQQPIEMSAEQIKAFQAIFPDDHRPVQELNGREVAAN